VEQLGETLPPNNEHTAPPQPKYSQPFACAPPQPKYSHHFARAPPQPKYSQHFANAPPQFKSPAHSVAIQSHRCRAPAKCRNLVLNTKKRRFTRTKNDRIDGKPCVLGDFLDMQQLEDCADCGTHTQTTGRACCFLRFACVRFCLCLVYGANSSVARVCSLVRILRSPGCVVWCEFFGGLGVLCGVWCVAHCLGEGFSRRRVSLSARCNTKTIPVKRNMHPSQTQYAVPTSVVVRRQSPCGATFSPPEGAKSWLF
jgi:hypothetical protein